jgi:hypothetical protein
MALGIVCNLIEQIEGPPLTYTPLAVVSRARKTLYGHIEYRTLLWSLPLTVLTVHLLTCYFGDVFVNDSTNLLINIFQGITNFFFEN